MPVASRITGVVVAVGMVLLPRSQRTDFPNGAYAMVIRTGDRTDVTPGEYIISFDGHGVFQLQRDTTMLVTGAYASLGDTLQVEDEEGPNACVPPDVRGAYRWTTDRGDLTIRLLNDACSGWRTTLVLRPLVRKP